MSPILVAHYRRASGALALGAVAVGVAVIGGWLLGLPRLTDYYAAAPEAKFNAGVCLVLCGLSLWLLHAEAPSTRARVAARLLAGAATLVAFLTLLEHLFGWDLGIDQLVVREPPGALGALAPGRMAPIASGAVLFIGPALLLLDSHTRRGRWPANAFAALATLGTLFAACEYVFGVSFFNGVGPGRYLWAALPMTLGLTLLCIGLLFARVEHGLMARFASDGPGGQLLRRLAPALILLPLGLGGLLAAGGRAEVFAPEFGLALFVTAVVSITVAFVLASGQAIDRMHTAEQARTAELRAAEARSRDALDNLRLVAVQLDAAGRVTYANDHLLALTGWRREDVLGQDWFERFVPAAEVREVFLATFTTGSMPPHYENPIRTRGGEDRLIAWNNSVVRDISGAVVGTLSVGEDITERRAAEEAIRVSEGRFRSLFASMTEGFAHCRMLFEDGEPADFIYLDVNAAFGIQTGLKNVVGRRVSEVIPGIRQADPELFVRYGRVALTGIPERFEMYVSALEAWFDISVYCPQPEHFVAVFDVITERKRTEEALRESERKYRTLVEGLPVGIYRSSPEGHILAANRAWLDLMGYDSEEQVRHLSMARDVYVDPDARARLWDAVTAEPGGTSFEVQWKRRDGTPIDVRITTRPVKDVHGTTVAFESAVEDVTRRHALEEQLRHAQKIEAVGQLAGGVAHDFNNLLTTIVTSVDLLSDLAPAGSEAAEDLAAIKHAAERGGELTRKLLAFGRKQRLELRTLDLNALVRDFSKLAKRLVREDIDVIVTCAPGALPVQVDPTAVDQMLINLTTNARDAMPRGGVLSIQTGRVTLDEDWVATNGWGAAGSFALLTVSDTGEGMDAATLRHLFEPFFTTKPVGEGTGLGTAMVSGLVEEHRGYIHAESEPGQGTTMRIHLPLARQDVEAPVTPGAGPLLDGSETLLLVDDEEQLRTSAKRLLERHGYTVHMASDGADALGVHLAREGEIALIITDVVMPRMSGPELRAELRRRGKTPRILFTSGYTARDAMQAKHLGEGTRFIPKPWTATGLLLAVREALDGEPVP